MGSPIDDLSAAANDVMASFRMALDSLNVATHSHEEAAKMLSEEVHKKAGGEDVHE